MVPTLDVSGPTVHGHANAKFFVRFTKAQPAPVHICKSGQQHSVPPTPLQQHLIPYDRRLHASKGKT